MKKTIYILFVILVCCCLPVQAYEYFTINFTDGTKSDAFYATDVESISYSKLDLDGMEHSDWQVQEIQTSDSLYRIPLKDIAYLDFKDVDENKVAEDINKVNLSISPLYIECRSIEEMTSHLPTIKLIDGVEDAWTDSQALFVKIRDWGMISYLYPPALEPVGGLTLLTNKRHVQRSSSLNDHIHATTTRACIFYQPSSDENKDYKEAKDVADGLALKLRRMGISCDYEDVNKSPSFFVDDIFNYDLVFLMTHGDYDGKHHWLFTGEEILCSYDDSIVNDAQAWLKYLLKHKLSPNKMSIDTQFEIRSGRPVVVHYVKVSEQYIGSSKKTFVNPNSAMVFNLSCQSLKGPDDKMDVSLAQVFLNKHVGCYLGYTDTNGIGHGGGEYFFYGLLNGKHAQSSFNDIPSNWKNQNKVYNGIECHPVLKLISNSNAKDNCITHTETSPADIITTEDNVNYVLHGSIKMIHTPEIIGSFKYGFQWSTHSDMSSVQDINVEGDYDSNTLYMNWEKILDENTLQPNTTYYYRAYMKDGTEDNSSYCYGDVRSFTTQPPVNAEPYIVFCDSIATFYYDDKKLERLHGLIGLIWSIEDQVSYNSSPVTTDECFSSINRVIFDSSFRNYLPVSTAEWFSRFPNLKTIENLCYLNTSNVTNMSYMFRGCYSLTSLDLSGFNTSNVKIMASMFEGCTSLRSLDLSSFDTSNVTDMFKMFYCCNSLTSLDVSSFDTSNVMGMLLMFCGCNSLTSLDLSSFDTSNVTDMGGMFAVCSSLTSLDLSSFITSKVTRWGGMFEGCSSLTRIYAGNWRLDNAIGSESYNYINDEMFEGCYNLVGGMGSTLAGTIYGYDSNGIPMFYNCGANGNFAHIDGGRDWPGLFTAK